MFTGDASGDFLWPALHAPGLASRPDVAAAPRRPEADRPVHHGRVKCAPPDNKPLPSERDNCAPYLVRELDALDRVRVVVALGAFAWDAALRTFAALGARRRRARSRASGTAPRPRRAVRSSAPTT